MRQHLTDSELADGMARGLDAAGRLHLVECAACRAEFHQLRAAVAALASDVHKHAARPPGAWDRQRARIMSRVGQSPRGSDGPRGWAWARRPAAALIAAALVGVIWWSGRSSTPGQDPTLLVAVQHAISADAPSALRPLALLVNELERASADPRYGPDMKK